MKLSSFIRGLAVLTCLFCTVVMNGQSSRVIKSTEPKDFIDQLNLDDTQVAKLERLEAFKQEQIKQVKSLKTSDKNLYAQKMMAIEKGHFASIGLMLTPEQKKVWQAEKTRKRKQRARKQH